LEEVVEAADEAAAVEVAVGAAAVAATKGIITTVMDIKASTIAVMVEEDTRATTFKVGEAEEAAAPPREEAATNPAPKCYRAVNSRPRARANSRTSVITVTPSSFMPR
jgi:hypothetical protein